MLLKYVFKMGDFSFLLSFPLFRLLGVPLAEAASGRPSFRAQPVGLGPGGSMRGAKAPRESGGSARCDTL